LLRAFDGILRRIGEDAVLRSTTSGAPPVEVPGTPVRVHREFGVEMQGQYGDLSIARIVATMHRTLLPRQGDRLDMGTVVLGALVATDRYIIDSPPFADNGVSVRVVLREA
jgi:hypothetical protein